MVGSLCNGGGCSMVLLVVVEWILRAAFPTDALGRQLVVVFRSRTELDDTNDKVSRHKEQLRRKVQANSQQVYRNKMARRRRRRRQATMGLDGIIELRRKRRGTLSMAFILVNIWKWTFVEALD